jgi:NAD(P)-dependent dehydrogenase (short-subunit alcohol dehydrogenase family)
MAFVKCHLTKRVLLTSTLYLISIFYTNIIMSIRSKAVLISGAAQGIGRCMARTFLSKGHRVYILDINGTELDYTVNNHLKRFHPNIGSSICNLRDVDNIRSSVDEAAKFFGGKIDVLVNNGTLARKHSDLLSDTPHTGGIAHAYWKPAHTTMADPSTISQWQAYIETNLTAPFAVSQACIPHMKVADSNNEHAQVMASGDGEAGPCIVHISSFRWQQSDPNQEGYASTKAGLFGLTQSMAVSCSRWGIRVNMVPLSLSLFGVQCVGMAGKADQYRYHPAASKCLMNARKATSTA